jgi:hypothetical protein
MVVLTDSERHLLERLAAEGKRTRLALGELQVAKSLEADGLVFMIRDTLDAVITPKGRHLLAGLESSKKPGKKPFGYLD